MDFERIVLSCYAAFRAAQGLENDWSTLSDDEKDKMARLASWMQGAFVNMEGSGWRQVAKAVHERFCGNSTDWENLKPIERTAYEALCRHAHMLFEYMETNETVEDTDAVEASWEDWAKKRTIHV